MNVTMKRTGVTLGMAVLLLSGCGTKNPKPDLDLRQERSTAFHEGWARMRRWSRSMGN